MTSESVDQKASIQFEMTTRTLALLLLATLWASGCSKTPEGSIEKARQYVQKGETRTALIELQNVLQQGPNAEAHFLLAKIYNDNNHFDNSEKELTLARKQGYDLGQISALTGRLFLNKGDPERVLQEVGPIASAPPEVNAIVYALRARAHLVRKDITEAMQSLERADRYVYDHHEALLLRATLAQSPADAMVLVERAIQRAPAFPDAWRVKGQLLRDQGKHKESLAALNKALELAPTDVESRLARGLLHIQTGQLAAAETDMAVARKQAPNRAPVRYLDALPDFQNKRYPDAVNKLLTVVGSAPAFIPARALLGAASLATGQREQAVSNLTYVVNAQPDNGHARKLLATALVQNSDVVAAQQLLANMRLENDPRMMALQGDIALSKSDLASARRHFQAAAKAAPKDPAILNKLATSLLSSGQESEALQVLSRVIDLDAENIAPSVTLVNTLLQSKRYAEALQVAEKHVAATPKDPAAYNMRGIVQVNAGDEAGARRSFEQALALKPSYLPAARNLARLDARANNLKGAKGRINAILKADPKNVSAWLALADFAKEEKDDATLLNALENAKQIDKANMPVRLRLVQHWLSKKEPDKALNTAMEASIDNPGREDAISLVGLVRWQRGELNEALTVFRNWAQSKPDSYMAQYAKAHAELATGDAASALISLDRALTLRPDFFEASRAKALIQADAGKPLHGLSLARDIQSKSPNSPQGFLLEAEVMEHSKRHAEAARAYSRLMDMTGQPAMAMKAAKRFSAAGQGAEAEKTLTRWLSSHPQDRVVRRELGQFLISKSRLRDALPHFEQLVKDNEQDGAALNNLAWLYGELKNPQAVATAERALKAAPDNAAVLDTLGWLQVQQGNPQRGIDVLRRALAKLPGNPEIAWHLASAYVKTGDKASARVELERLLSSGRPFPRQAEAKKLLETLR